MQTTGQKCNQFCLKKCQNCGMLRPYLEPPWEIQKNKHTCFGSFVNWNVKKCEKANTIWISQSNARILSGIIMVIDPMTKYYSFRSNILHNFQKISNFGISWSYLESPCEMHSNKYKHVWFGFTNLWNRPLKCLEFALGHSELSLWPNSSDHNNNLWFRNKTMKTNVT